MADNGWQFVADDLCCLTLGGNPRAVAAALRDSNEWTDVVCGENTVFVHFDPSRIDPEKALEKLKSLDARPAERLDAESIVEIPACYHPSIAPDLIDTCTQLGLSTHAFVRTHCSCDHEVAMLGFMPGFAYIDGLDSSLHVSRLDEPRQRVAAGSIGIAGRQTGIYPSVGPGGWRLVARTPLRLFDVTAAPPALLQPMQRVRFVPITLDEFEAAR